MTRQLNKAATGVVDYPKITIITVVFNGYSFIENTILSVIGQTYPNIEYIVIDGGSTDGTIDILKQYENQIDYWYSQKDGGIYDAMNKGLARSTGRWVNFMNAGDVFNSPDTISRIFLSKSQNAIIIYGGVEIKYSDFTRTQGAGCPSQLWSGMQFCHQSAFVDVVYHQSHLFNIKNKVAADLEFFYQAYKSGATFYMCEMVIACVITGGVSEANRIKTIWASCDAICGDEFRPLVRLYYLGRVVESGLRSLAKLFLPSKLVKFLILLK